MLAVQITALLEELREGRVELVSRELDFLPGLMTRASIATAVAQCDRAVIFLTPHYIKDDTTRFELEMIKRKAMNNVVLVAVGISSTADLEQLPEFLTSTIVNEKHVVWPTGPCAGGASTFRAFVQTLERRLCSDASD